MPTKIGGGGKPQEYDPSNGRYGCGFAHSSNTTIPTNLICHKKNAQNAQMKLFERAQNSSDALLFEIYKDIQTWRPGFVCKVNEKFSFPGLGKGEVDIETKKHIIEVKSGKARRHTKQYRKELKYACAVGKELIIYAPKMQYGTMVNLVRQGFRVIQNKEELETIIKKGSKR